MTGTHQKLHLGWKADNRVDFAAQLRTENGENNYFEAGMRSKIDKNTTYKQKVSLLLF